MGSYTVYGLDLAF